GRTPLHHKAAPPGAQAARAPARGRSGRALQRRAPRHPPRHRQPGEDRRRARKRGDLHPRRPLRPPQRRRV
ncbi:MAG: UPF0758 family protein, partial [uncultured Rubrobacteraceae bacterium]